MYQVGGWLDLLKPGTAGAAEAAARGRLPRNVLFLGLTSLFTDISSEMVVSILPIYMVGFLRMSPAQFGVVDGLYQGIAGVVQFAGAGVADRLRRYKEVAAIGYGISVVCRAGFLLTSSWGGLVTLLAADRIGKGLRTPPRDALISLSVPTSQLATGFGVHRAFDAVGAMLGPVVAFLILRTISGAFDVVFVSSLCVGIVGFAVLWLFVENVTTTSARSASPPMIITEALHLLREPRFRHLALTACLLGGLTISDAFVYLVLQRRANVAPPAFPLLFVLTSASYLILAIPFGRLADRLGRLTVFLAGHVPLLIAYVALVAAPGGVGLVVFVVLALGGYYAATEGVLMAMGSAVVPASARTTGLATLTTLLAVARLVGSLSFGFAWTRFGLGSTVGAFMLLMFAALILVIASRPARN
jgi:MFS family permease